MTVTLNLTAAEAERLAWILGLDLDAIGFEQKDQTILRRVRKKLMAAGSGQIAAQATKGDEG